MRTINLDSQILNSIQSCARKTELSFINQIAPIDKAEALERGDLMHKLLELYYSLKSGLRNNSDTFLSLGEAGFRIPNTSDGNNLSFILEAGRFFTSKMNLDLAESEEIMYQFSEYVRFYENDAWNPLAVEEIGSKMIFEDSELRIIYSYKIDMIAENGKLQCPWDHKTSKRRQDPSSLSNQFMGYATMTNSPYILINKIGFQKTLEPKDRFQRHIITYDETRLKEWLDNTIWWARLLDHYLQTNEWPMNLTSCDKYAGCIFSQICESSPESREWKVARDYKKGETWDVAKILES